MTKKIVIAGNFGFHNTGDEAILSSMISSLRTIRPNLNICVVSGDPEETKTVFHVDSVYWKDLPAILDSIEKSDMILLGGGGIFHDYWGVQPETLLTKDHAGLSYYSEFALLAYLFQKPLMIYAVGIGPVLTSEGQDLTRLSFLLAQKATVRDLESKKILQNLDCKVDNISITSDPAFSLIEDENSAQQILSELIPKNEIPLYAVCLRNWDVTCDQESWQKNTADGLDRLIESQPCNLLFIPFHNLPDFPLTNDINAAEKVIAFMQHRESAFILRGSHHPNVIAGLIAHCKMVIGMRLHSIIFAANATIPAVGLVYDPKVKQMMNRLGLGDYAIDLAHLNPEILISTINQALLKQDQIRVMLGKKRATLNHLAAQNVSITIDLLENNENINVKTNEVLDKIRWLAIKQSRLFYEKDKIALLYQTEAEKKETIIQRERMQIAGLEAKIFELQNEIRNRDVSINRADHLIEQQEYLLLESEQNIKTLNNVIEVKNQVIQGFNDHLDGISRSRGWRFLQLLWNIRVWVLPHGSKRDKLLKSLWHGFLAIFHFENIKNRIRPPRIFREGYIDQDNSNVTVYSDDPNIYPDYSPRKPLLNDELDDIKISLIATVKNDKNNIESWLGDIKNLTRLPDEIIIVDGGSIDGTFEILESEVNDFPVPLAVFQKSGSNRSEGRNFAIKNAKFPLIAVTDFGCHIHPHWFENLIQPFIIDPETVVSAGFYQCAETEGNSDNKNRLWANLQTIYPQSFLPSSRSVAFTKAVVEAIGGHPEWLVTTGDDTYLDLELKRFGGKWAFVPDAIVYWQAPMSLSSFFKKHFQWAIGDGESGVHARYYWRYVVQLISWMMITLILISLIILFILLPVKPAVLWSVFAVAGYIIGLGITAKNTGLSIPLLIQRMFGEVAQVLGFIEGAGHRKEVEQRRYALLKGTIFILAGVPLDDSGGGSRGAQIANELLRQGYAVIYINRFPKFESKELNIRFAHPNLIVSTLSDFNWEKFISEYPGLVIGKALGGIIEFPLPEFISLIEKIKANKGRILYDLLDDWQTSLGGDWYSFENELKIINKSDILAATEKSLQEHLKKISRRPVALIENAVNANLFNASSRFTRPIDLPESERVITYTGALWGDWFDWDLLGKIARQYDDTLVCVIGDYRGQFINPPLNLKFLGLKNQSDLPAYLAFSDVAIIPWKINRITQATSPLKLYEYLAMHCPVVAPDLKPLHCIPGVFLAKDHLEFIDLVGTVDRSFLDFGEIDGFIDQNNWQKRVEQMLDLLRIQNDK